MSMSRVLCSALLVVSTACSRKPSTQHPSTPVEESRPKKYRSQWLDVIAPDIDAIAKCVAPRESPAYVVHIHHEADEILVVTTVDAYGALETCGVADGDVVLRKPSTKRLSALPGQPLFSPGPERPHVPVGNLLEEVAQDDQVLGWLYWPPAKADEESSETEDES